jgi:crossover junction endodeoxyribonuclease RuvC
MILAIDPSLQCTGVAVLGPSQVNPYWAVRSIKTSAPVAPPTPHLAQLNRMERIVGEISRAGQEMTGGVRLSYAVIEGPAFSKNEGMAHERAGLWWMLYQMLAAQHLPILVVKPNLRAKYATGNGTSGKDEVMLAASRRYPDVPITNNNEADAVILACMGARMLGTPVDRLPAAHVDALKTL